MNKQKIFTMTITGGLLLSSSFNVFAIETNSNHVNIQSSKPNCVEMHHKRGHRFNIDKWVEEGIITKEQADKWKKFNEDHRKQRKAEMDQVKKMTEEERKAFFEKRKSEKKDYFSQLIKEGILTEEQVDKIKEKILQRSQYKEKEVR